MQTSATPRDWPIGPGSRLQAELFWALGDPVRLALLGRLACCAAPLAVSELQDCCGVHLSGVSRHLAILRDAGVASAERRGREVLYSLEVERLAAALRALADALEDCRRSCVGTKPRRGKSHCDE